MALLVVLAFTVLFLACFGLFIIDQQTVGIVERFGKFNRITTAGLHFKIPFIEQLKGNLSLRVQQLDVLIETKTKDNVFVKVTISVQYSVIPTKIYDAFYRLTNPRRQIESFVFDVIRAEVPNLTLDDLFQKKDNVAIAVKNELSGLMADFGHDILKALVTNIDPDEKVKIAMNEINSQQRLRMAAQEKGEAEKIIRVKNAEAEAESMHLQGIGVSNQRKAIIDGLKQSILEFQQNVAGVSASDVMGLVMMTQYYDTLKEIGAHNKSSTILIPHSPGSLKDIVSQLREGIVTANVVTNSVNESGS